MEVVTMVPCKGNPLLYKNWYLWRWPAQVWYFSTSSSHSHQIWIHNFSKPNCRSFWDSLHIIISVIDIVKAEAERVTIVPLKIINVGPHEKATNICSLPVWKLEKARNGLVSFSTGLMKDKQIHKLDESISLQLFHHFKWKKSPTGVYKDGFGRQWKWLPNSLKCVIHYILDVLNPSCVLKDFFNPLAVV